MINKIINLKNNDLCQNLDRYINKLNQDLIHKNQHIVMQLVIIKVLLNKIKLIIKTQVVFWINQ